MKKSLIALALVSAFAAPAFAEEAAPAAAPSLTGNIALTSNYVFRGISQSQNKPALQGGFDYAHSSGLYVGTWASNIGWVNTKDNSSLEWDFYAGYKGTFADDFSYDLGVLKYYYTGDSNGNSLTPDTTEVYAAIGWKFITLKYNYSVSKYLFAWGDQRGNGGTNRGSGYLDLSSNYDLGNCWGVYAHVGHQDVKNYSNASYTDWKLGVTKDFSGWVIGAAYVGTDAKGGTVGVQPYRFTKQPGTYSYDSGKDTIVVSVSRTF